MSFKNKYLTISLALTALVGLAGCQMQVPMLPGIGPHKIDIQQGNAISQEMVAKLQPGMTRAQVRFVLGTPLLVDPFRTDRWDYVYSYRKGGEVIEQRRMAVFFKDDRLVRIDGDVIAAKPPGEKPVAEKPPASKTAADKLKPEPAAVAKPDVKPEVKPAAAAVKPEEKPAAVTAKPEIKPAPQPEVAKPQPEIAKPEPVKPAPAATAPAVVLPAPPSATALPPATLTTGDGAPVGSSISTAEAKPVVKPEPKPAQKPEPKPEPKPETKAAAAKVDPKADAKAEDKPKEERGFFGRVFERMGF